MTYTRCERKGQRLPGYSHKYPERSQFTIEFGDDDSNDFLVSEVLRTNELQVWFLSEHLVKAPLVVAREPSSAADAGE